ncbi:MAG: DUF308 domain-containing protein [Methylococcales bacterium]
MCANPEIKSPTNSKKVKPEPLHEDETQATPVTPPANKKIETNDGKTVVIDRKTQESEAEFKRSHSCPADNNNKKSCSGYIITYVTPLECGGQNVSTNMQWQIILPIEQIKKRQHDQCEELAKATTNNRTVIPQMPITSSPPLNNKTSQSQEDENDTPQLQIQNNNKSEGHSNSFVSLVGVVILITGLILFVIAHIWFIIITFQTSVIWGLFCIFGPGIISLLFTILYWNISKRAFWSSVTGMLMMLFGWRLT